MFPPEFVVAALAKDVMPINLICRKLFAGGNNLAVMANFIDGETRDNLQSSLLTSDLLGLAGNQGLV
jgi:hypothetical protein